MRMKKILFIGSIMLIGLMLCAFTVLPMVSFTTAESTMDLTYLNADSNGDTMTVNVNFNSNGTNAEIIKDVRVYTDSSLSNQLEMRKCVAENEKYVYTFDIEGEDDINDIYIKPPVLYTPDTINTVAASAIENSVCKDENGDNWFTITGIKVTEKSDEDIILNLVINPHTDTLPRFPELVIDGDVYGGATAMEFDEEGEFIGGELIFVLPLDCMSTSTEGNISAGSEATLGGAMTVRISDVMNRVEADEKAFTSNVKNLTVVDSVIE